MDELIDITEGSLLLEERNGINVINTFGYNMINLNDGFNLQNITHGFREDILYDKCLIFNKKFVETMDWTVGCHQCNPKGKDIRFSSNRFTLLHYKYINEDYVVNRYKEFYLRQSSKNITNNWSNHYNVNEYELREYYKSCTKKQLTKLL